MPKNHDAESIFAMFSKFGEELKIPNVDVDSIMSHHRKNFEALERSAKASAAGASSLMNRQREMLQQTLEDAAEMARTFGSSGNPQELATKQTAFARKSFEAAIKNAEEVSELVKKSSADSIEILRARIRESMEEVRENFDKRK